MDPIAIPALADNLTWMLHDGRVAIVVDPGPAAPDANASRKNRLRLAAILVTRHRADHIGGLAGTCERLEGPARGAAHARMPLPVGTSPGKLSALAGDTRVCCAHECTPANPRFARTVEPHHTTLADTKRAARRANGRTPLEQ